MTAIAETVVAGAWKQYGNCSYLVTEAGLDSIRLVSESSCTKYVTTGTGFVAAEFRWENGNKFSYVMNANGPNGTPLDPPLETLNGLPILETGSTTNDNICYLVKEERGFSLSCYDPIGDEIYE